MVANPVQVRSIQSTKRMLDAAEALLFECGPDCLTVDAVVERAKTSNGSFYSRFGDRQGLLVAMQERFVSSVGDSMSQLVLLASADSSLYQAIEKLCPIFLGIFRQHRASFTAYMIQNRSNQRRRAQSSLASVAGAELIREILVYHLKDLSEGDLDLAAEMTYRTLFSAATVEVIFLESEVTNFGISTEIRDHETSKMILAYLDQSFTPALNLN